MAASAGVVGDDLMHVGWPTDRDPHGFTVFRPRDGAGTGDHEVDVVGVVVQLDGVGCVVCGRGLVVEGPPAAEGERVVGQSGGVVEGVGALVIGAVPTVVSCLCGTEVGFRGQRRRRGCVGRVDSRRQADVFVCLRKQLPDQAFGDVVVAFAELDVTDGAVGIDEVVSRPVLVAVVGPGRVVVVHRDGLGDPEPGGGGRHVSSVALERVFRCVDSNDVESFVVIGVVPADDVGDAALAVDARVGPEVD